MINYKALGEPIPLPTPWPLKMEHSHYIYPLTSVTAAINFHFKDITIRSLLFLLCYTSIMMMLRLFFKILDLPQNFINCSSVHDQLFHKMSLKYREFSEILCRQWKKYAYRHRETETFVQLQWQRYSTSSSIWTSWDRNWKNMSR